MSGTNVGLTAGIVLLLLVIAVMRYARDRNMKTFRIGFFAERERFEEDDDRTDDGDARDGDQGGDPP